MSYFQCSKEEHDEIPMILDTQKTELKILDNTITGFNIGMNIGEDAGQTIFHCHIHIIPRINKVTLPILEEVLDVFGVIPDIAKVLINH